MISSKSYISPNDYRLNFPLAVQNWVAQLWTQRHVQSYICAQCLCTKYISRKKGLNTAKRYSNHKCAAQKNETINKPIVHSADRMMKHAQTSTIELRLFEFYMFISLHSHFFLCITLCFCRLSLLWFQHWLGCIVLSRISLSCHILSLNPKIKWNNLQNLQMCLDGGNISLCFQRVFHVFSLFQATVFWKLLFYHSNDEINVNW